ncbi:MAG: BspA family leucine-rich repeat surface protein [Bacteroidales bacterium]|nr:BspA family leucine-rich repeat surface protein [Bacteroidales bacterium]
MRKIKKIIFTFCLALFAGFSLAQAQDPNPEAFITVWEPIGTSIKYPGIGANYTIVVRDLSTNTVLKTIPDASSTLNNPFEVTGLTPGVRYAFEVVPNTTTAADFNGFRVLQGTTEAPDEEKLNLVEISQWGTIKWSYNNGLFQAFKGCKNLELTATDQPVFASNMSLTSMFEGCTSLTGAGSSISDWDTSKVRLLNYVFMGATSFNQPLNWDVTNVNNFLGAFEGASSFNQDLGSWEMTGVNGVLRSANRMFDNSGMSPENYAATLIGWANNPATASGAAGSIPFTAAGVCYDKSATAARDKLIGMGWAITDAGVCTETSVELTPDNASKFSLLKNPVQENAYFIFEPSSDGTKIIIADLSGKLIVSKPIAEGASETSISLNHLPKGVYVALHQKAQGKQSVLKLIK